MSEKDALDNLAHDIRNALTVIFFVRQKMVVDADHINMQGKRMKDAFDKFEKEARGCPYAGQKGAKCKKCNTQTTES